MCRALERAQRTRSGRHCLLTRGKRRPRSFLHPHRGRLRGVVDDDGQDVTRCRSGNHLTCWVCFRVPRTTFQVGFRMFRVPVGMPKQWRILRSHLQTESSVRAAEPTLEPGSWNPGTVPNQMSTGLGKRRRHATPGSMRVATQDLPGRDRTSPCSRGPAETRPGRSRQGDGVVVVRSSCAEGRSPGFLR
jgi:hypothetical protein